MDVRPIWGIKTQSSDAAFRSAYQPVLEDVV
jgi:hypothetical protein